MVRNNGKASKVAHPGRHTADVVAHEIESMSDRATKLVHQAIETVADSLHSGKESILDTTKHAKEVAEEKITSHPYAAIGAAFAAGMVATALLRWTLRSRE